MGIFDFFKKDKLEATRALSPVDEMIQRNEPTLLVVRLLFRSKPTIDIPAITEKARHQLGEVIAPDGETFIFHIPGIQVDLNGLQFPAQCTIMVPDEKTTPQLPPEAYQQNWHWQDGNAIARDCKYELVVTDLFSRTLDYKTRLSVFSKFVLAVSEVLAPDAIYSTPSQKLIAPQQLIGTTDSKELELLLIANVRLFNIQSSGAKEMLMDTVGLNVLGLTDFEILFSAYAPNDVGGMLWNYVAYTYENGDRIQDGNTIDGINPGAKWRCHLALSNAAPDRAVLAIKPE